MVDLGHEVETVARCRVVDILEHERAASLAGALQHRPQAIGAGVEERAADIGIVHIVERVPEIERAVDHHLVGAERLGDLQALEEAALDDFADIAVGVGQVQPEEGSMDAAQALMPVQRLAVGLHHRRRVAGDHVGEDEILDLDRAVVVEDPVAQHLECGVSRGDAQAGEFHVGPFGEIT